MSAEVSPNRIGYRHVFGVLVPDFNSVVEPEMASLRVSGTSNQTIRFALDANVIQHIGTAAERLASCGVRSWIVGLSTEAFPGGMALLDQGIQALTDRTGLPVFTAPYATRAAIEKLNAERIAIVTPFDVETNKTVAKVYETWGYEVVAITGLSRPGFDQIANTPDETTLRAFDSIAGDKIDAFVQVGGGLPMLHLVEDLEKRLGRPVVTANLAPYWQAMRAAQIDDVVPFAGRLFEESR